MSFSCRRDVVRISTNSPKTIRAYVFKDVRATECCRKLLLRSVEYAVDFRKRVSAFLGNAFNSLGKLDSQTYKIPPCTSDLVRDYQA